MIKEKISNVWNYPINSSQIYFLAFIVYFLPTFLNDTTFAEIIGDHRLRVLSYLSLPLLIFKIFVLDRWNKKQLVLIFIMFIIGLLSWRSAHEIQLLMIVPFVIGAKNVKFKDIISWYFYLCVTFILIMAVLALLGIIVNLILYSDNRPTRYSLGMNYPSNNATHYLFLCLAYCYLRFGKLKFWDYLGIVIGDIIFMLLTNTKLDFVAVLVMIPVMMISQRAFQGHKTSQIFASFWWIAVPAFSLISIISSYFFSPYNHIMRKDDSLTSGRLTLGHQAFNKYDIKLFGQTIVEHSFAGIKGLKLANSESPNNHYFYVDSSYMRMFLIWGILAFILIVFCFSYIAIRSTIHKTYIMSAIILIASLNFMFEPDVIKMIYDPFLLALLAIPSFYNPQEENNYEKRKG